MYPHRNPFNPTFSCYDSQLKLYEVRQNSQGHRETALLKSVATHADVNTLDWYQHISKAQSLAYGTASGSVLFIDWSKDENATYVVKGMNKYHSRPCTEVAWNKQISGHLAAGFEKLRKYINYVFVFHFLLIFLFREKCAFVYDLESCGAVEPDGGEIPIISVYDSLSSIRSCTYVYLGRATLQYLFAGYLSKHNYLLLEMIRVLLISLTCENLSHNLRR